MTKDEAMKLALDALKANVIGTSGRMPKTHEAITALREALAEQPAQQEPVGEAYLCDKCHTPFDGCWYCPECNHNTATKELVYTSPPAQRKPLTDEQIEAIHQSTWIQSTATLNDFARAIEAAHGIKEKNT